MRALSDPKFKPKRITPHNVGASHDFTIAGGFPVGRVQVFPEYRWTPIDIPVPYSAFCTCSP